MKFSLDTQEFKEKLIDLRKDLNQTLEDGQVQEGFQEKLGDLEKKEKILLQGLLPYYRLYAPEAYETKLNRIPVNLEGAYQAETYLTAYIQVEKETYFFAGADQKVYLARLFDKENPKIELTPPLKDFHDLVLYMDRIAKGKILAFTVTGDLYIFSYRKIEDVFEGEEGVKVRKIPTNFPGFERILSLEDHQYLCQIGERNFLALDFKRETEEVRLKFQGNLSGSQDEITSFLKLSQSKLALGTRSGDLLEVTYGDQGLEIENKVKIFPGPIGKLSLLENENGDQTTCGILGSQGNFALYDWGRKEVIRAQALQGQLFRLESKRGTALVLSEDGLAYLLEENLGQWRVNAKVTLSDLFLLNTIPLDSANYLALDLEGKCFLLKIDRLDSVEKLHAMNLCQ